MRRRRSSSRRRASAGRSPLFARVRHTFARLPQAYLKGLKASGFKIPAADSNILLSCGSFRERSEMLPSARTLVALGYQLFGTPGTADFYNEHEVACAVIDWPVEDIGEVRRSPAAPLGSGVCAQCVSPG